MTEIGTKRVRTVYRSKALGMQRQLIMIRAFKGLILRIAEDKFNQANNNRRCRIKRENPIPVL